MNRIYLSIGSNLGDTESNIKKALELLTDKVQIIKISSFYDTEPVGYADQPWFLNIALEGVTALCPDALLEFTQSVEQRMKRVKTVLNGPRVIDVDILLYNDEIIDTERLTIPHPRMLRRAFVLAPLSEIAPELTVGGRGIKEYLSSLTGEKVGRRAEKADAVKLGMQKINNLLKDTDFTAYMQKNAACEIDREYCHHDLTHALDVARISYILNLEENTGVPKKILYAAALVHDIGRWREYEAGIRHEEAGAFLAEKLLKKCGFAADETGLILEAVANHRSGTSASPLSDLLYRADKLARNCTVCPAIKTCKNFLNGEEPFFKY